MGILLALLLSLQDEADVLYVNGTIHTVTRGRAEAMAVKGDRIVAVGRLDDLEKLRAARVVDLRGRCVTPGLIDAHGHVAGLGSLLTGRIDLRSTKSLEELVREVEAKAKKLKKGDWILGGRWDQANWNQKEFPTHEKLSAVTPDHPVLLSRVDGHAALANRRAMELAGVTRDTPNPSGGEILRDSKGEPTGIFVDNAIDLFDRVVVGGRSVRDEILAAQDRCLSVGLTGVHDAGIGSHEVEVYRALEKDGKLKLRVYAMGGPGFAEGKPTVGDRFTLRAIKMMVDGAMGSRGAWLLEDYADRAGHRGLPVTDPKIIERVARAALKNGWQVCTHAIGDRGIRETLDAYERALKDVPVKDHRFRVEHAQCPALSDIDRFAKLAVVPSMQPTHATSDMRWAEDRVGPERVKGAYAWSRFLRSGCRIAAGSDFPVESENPLWGIYAAATRQDHEGRPEGGWRAEERMTREEALRAFTLDAAWAAFEEDRKGSLEAGKLADFVVWSVDIVTCDPKALLKAEAMLTVVGGVTVFERK